MKQGMLIDLFAGGGGASTGIEQGLGRHVDVAINHWDLAIQMHEANHPDTWHSQSDVFSRKVNPRLICEGQPVDLLWLSPDCTHHSKAKGGQPVCRKRRGLAWVGVKWAKQSRPKVIMLENVEEFEDWGPLDKATGKPDPRRRGLTFKMFVGRLRGLGYKVEWRELVAADYGAPTTRKRLYLIARCDGRPIVWPEPTHAQDPDAGDMFNRNLLPWRSAAECIDWSIPCPSIFMSPEEAKAWARATGNGIPKRPLAEDTMERLAKGVHQFIIKAQSPFILGIDNKSSWASSTWGIGDPLRTITQENRFAMVTAFLKRDFGNSIGRALNDPAPTITQCNHDSLVTAFLTKHYGGVVGTSLERPIGTITTIDHHSLTAAYLTKFYGTNTGSDLRQPMPTITANGQHIAQVQAFLIKYYGTNVGQSLRDPLGTVTTHDRFGLVMIAGDLWRIVDIGMRMLTPRELARAQGFPDSYILTGTKTDQVALIGNSVCPPVAEALVRANCAEFEFVEVAA